MRNALLLGLFVMSVNAMDEYSVASTKSWCLYSGSSFESFKSPITKMPDPTKQNELVDYDCECPFVRHPSKERRGYIFYDQRLIEYEKLKDENGEKVAKVGFKIPLNFNPEKLVINNKGTLLIAASYASCEISPKAILVSLLTQKMVALADYSITTQSYFTSLRFGNGATVVAEYNLTQQIWDFTGALGYLAKKD